MGEKGEGEEKEQGGSREKQLWCVGRVNIWPPADVCLMGTGDWLSWGICMGNSAANCKHVLEPFPWRGPILHLSFLLGHIFSLNVGLMSLTPSLC